jgi:hypothetical protein
LNVFQPFLCDKSQADAWRTGEKIENPWDDDDATLARTSWQVHATGLEKASG